MPSQRDEQPVTRQDRRAKRKQNRRKMAVHGQRLRKRPQGGSLDERR